MEQKFPEFLMLSEKEKWVATSMHDESTQRNTVAYNRGSDSALAMSSRHHGFKISCEFQGRQKNTAWLSHWRTSFYMQWSRYIWIFEMNAQDWIIKQSYWMQPFRWVTCPARLLPARSSYTDLEFSAASMDFHLHLEWNANQCDQILIIHSNKWV